MSEVCVTLPRAFTGEVRIKVDADDGAAPGAVKVSAVTVTESNKSEAGPAGVSVAIRAMAADSGSGSGSAGGSDSYSSGAEAHKARMKAKFGADYESTIDQFFDTLLGARADIITCMHEDVHGRGSNKYVSATSCEKCKLRFTNRLVGPGEGYKKMVVPEPP